MIEKFAIINTISNLTKNVDGGRGVRMIHDNMRQAIANKLVGTYIEEQVNEFSTEYRMQIVVATEQDYWRDVNEKAMEIASRMYSCDTRMMP
jgi:hypothetical protein